ncbi:MAG: DUF2147 domain-containing protein [Mucilaginibacter sp.]
MSKKLTCLLIAITCCLTAFAQKSDAVLGKWTSATGEAQILIYKKGDKYFGKIDWLKYPNDDTGKPKTDKKNPDKSLRARPELGLELLKDFTFAGDDVYDDGTIYDPKSGKTYSCKMTMNGTKLKIRGYVGISLLGRTEIWTRAK